LVLKVGLPYGFAGSLEGKEEDYALKSTCKYKRNIKS
jgi:hypothetical protein